MENQKLKKHFADLKMELCHLVCQVLAEKQTLLMHLTTETSKTLEKIADLEDHDNKENLLEQLEEGSVYMPLSKSTIQEKHRKDFKKSSERGLTVSKTVISIDNSKQQEPDDSFQEETSRSVTESEPSSGSLEELCDLETEPTNSTDSYAEECCSRFSMNTSRPRRNAAPSSLQEPSLRRKLRSHFADPKMKVLHLLRQLLAEKQTLLRHSITEDSKTLEKIADLEDDYNKENLLEQLEEGSVYMPLSKSTIQEKHRKDFKKSSERGLTVSKTVISIDNSKQQEPDDSCQEETSRSVTESEPSSGSLEELCDFETEPTSSTDSYAEECCSRFSMNTSRPRRNAAPSSLQEQSLRRKLRSHFADPKMKVLHLLRQLLAEKQTLLMHSITETSKLLENLEKNADLENDDNKENLLEQLEEGSVYMPLSKSTIQEEHTKDFKKS